MSLEYSRHVDPLASARGLRDSAHERVFQSPSIIPAREKAKKVDRVSHLEMEVRGSSAEVGYLAVRDGRIHPLEVKSGTAVSSGA